MTAPLILNVDDYDANRFVRTRLLRKAGYRVLEASGGRQALEVVERESPDLLVLDVQMPDIDGLEVCRRIKTDPRTATILVLHVSATARDPASQVTGLENGADGYLTDAAEPEVLLATVQALLRLRRAEHERNEALARLREREEQLLRANELKDEFLATLSHELRTPMNAIVGWSQMLRHPGLSPDNMARAVDAIARNASVQMQLISDVLDVSRIVAGKMRVDVRPVDLVTVLEAALETIRPAAEARQLDLVVDSPGMVPVMADPDRLQQVFWNILSNAIKFTPPGGRVEIAVRLADTSTRVTIRDTGAGIPASFLPHVFERFRQLDSAPNRRHTGLGLGLALVRHLVELHGGEVTASSGGEGQGAEFTVTLPAARDLGPSDRAGAPQEGVAAPVAPEDPAATLRVLVVDDDEDCREVIAAFLEELGAEVLAVASAGAAIDGICQWVPDLVISDIGMPGEDGYELLRQIRALPPERGGKARAIALTADGQTEDGDRARAEGFELHVSKPVALEALRRAMAALGLPRAARR